MEGTDAPGAGGQGRAKGLARSFSNPLLDPNASWSAASQARLVGQGKREPSALAGEKQIGVQGAHVNPLASFLNPLGLFLRTSMPCIWRILSTFLRA